MNTSSWSKKLPTYVGIPLAIALVLYLIWDGLNDWGGSEILTGIGLMLVIGAILYLKQMENKAEKNVAQRIKAEYPSESQPQVFEIYEHLKIKELEGLFLKILDEAKGDLNEVKKLAALQKAWGGGHFSRIIGDMNW